MPDILSAVRQQAVEIYQSELAPTSFLRSLFPGDVRRTLGLINIETRRKGRRVAVDIVAGSTGNANRAQKSTASQFDAPEFREYTPVAATDLYARGFGENGFDGNALADIQRNMADSWVENRYSIERAIELMCRDALYSGEITLVNNDNVIYNRDPNSVIDATANGGAWSTATSKIDQSLIKAAEFIQNKGNVQLAGLTLNVLMDAKAYQNFKANTKVQEDEKYNNINNVDLIKPTGSTAGATYMGVVTAGSYSFKIWTYPQSYEVLDLAGSTTETKNYIPDNTALVFADNPQFKTIYQAIPMVPMVNGVARPTFEVAQSSDGFVTYQYADGRSNVVENGVRCKPIPVPVAIDTFSLINTEG